MDQLLVMVFFVCTNRPLDLTEQGERLLFEQLLFFYKS